MTIFDNLFQTLSTTYIPVGAHIQLQLKQVVSLAVFLLRPQADFKSAHE